MNTFAVWPASAGDSVTIRRSVVLQAGYYYVIGAVDNFGTVNINGQYTIALYNFDVNISRTELRNNTRVYHPGGPMTITISATNTGGPRGVAIAISDETVTNTFTGGIAFFTTTVSIGNLVWSTRSPGTATVGRYQVTMPFRANITAHAWGAGAGAGGLDSIEGGRGSPGLYNTNYFEVEQGAVVEVFVGSGGQPAAPTVKRQGSTAGGAGGSARVNVNGVATQSFNGGTGGRAGPGGWSGGGGGGGGASGVLVNGVPAIVAGGGGGGGGGGNFSFPGPRQSGDITKNAIGGYAIGTKALDITNSASYTLNAGAQVNVHTNFSTLPAPPSITETSQVIVFGWGSIPANAQTRTITTNSKINLSSSNVLTFYVNKGTESDWGQIPDSGEFLRLEYSVNGSTWVEITTVPVNVVRNTWLIRSPQIPQGAKVTGGVFLRFRQVTQASSSTGKRDTWAISGIWVGSLTLDYRGESGSSKGVNEGSADGGGGGGGGGGYPGGQGGGTPGGDIPGESGQCGGNFPDNVGATTGTNRPYYKSGYAGGSNPPNGVGQNGRVFLLIEPIGLVSVKVAEEWRQSQQAFVKVDGTWRDIDAIYIKIADTWREINGSGQGDVALVGNSQSYGASVRSYS
jgi:hypothetical protein